MDRMRDTELCRYVHRVTLCTVANQLLYFICNSTYHLSLYIGSRPTEWHYNKEHIRFIPGVLAVFSGLSPEILLAQC